MKASDPPSVVVAFFEKNPGTLTQSKEDVEFLQKYLNDETTQEGSDDWFAQEFGSRLMLKDRVMAKRWSDCWARDVAIYEKSVSGERKQ